MRRDRAIQLIAVGVLLACLAASGVLAVGLAASGGRNKLAYTDRAQEGDPPEVSLGIAMGAFRGVFVSLLWQRANAMKEEGRFHEAMDLADKITKLEPRFPQVWVFQAWNMAYNISVQTQTPAERWNWVQAGIRLLRDQGIPNNPNSLEIHKELGWIYTHKIQGYTDDANPYYKRQVAIEWTLILGPPPKPPSADTGRAGLTKLYVDWLTPIAQAPDSSQQVLAAEPTVRDLRKRLKEEAGIDPGPTLAEYYVRFSAIAASGARAEAEARMGPQPKALMALISDPQYARAWAALIPYLRKRILVDDYKMDPELMIQYTQKYGPLDWRHPGAHGVYWVAKGVDAALLRVTDENKRDFDFINTDRVLLQAVQELWRSGDVYFDFTDFALNGNQTPFYEAFPNLVYIDVYEQILDELVNRSWADQPFARTTQAGEEKLGRIYTVYAAGYENYMKDAIRYMYRRGEVQRAAEQKDRLAKWPGANLHDPDRKYHFAEPIDEFVRTELNDQFTRPSVAREEVVGSLLGAYVSLLRGEEERFRKQWDYARQAHAFFFNQQGRPTAVGPELWRMDQMPRDFRLLAAGVLAGLMSSIELDDAEAIYDNAPMDLRQFAYDWIVERFRARYDEIKKAGGRSFEQVFPEPPGMAEFRADIKARAAAERAKGQPPIEQK